MAARKPHPKSRLGCADCKRRRVKCDENRPDCDNCRKRGIQCSFKVFDPAPVPSRNSSISVERTLPGVHIFPQKTEEPPNGDSEQGLLDTSVQNVLLADYPEAERQPMKHILQHLATHTIPMITPSFEAQIAWRAAFPSLAKKHGFVLHGMLAISAIHLSISGSSEEQDMYQKIAAAQMNKGMVAYRVEVQNVTNRNAEALFAFSTTMTTYILFTVGIECEATLTSLRASSTPEEDPLLVATLVKETCRIFRSIRGVLVILVPCWDHIRSGMLQPIVQRDWWPSPIPITPEELDVDRKLHHLEKMWSRPGRPYDYSFDTLRQALKNLREAFASVSRIQSVTPPQVTIEDQSFDWTSVFQWAFSSCSPDFISLLEQRSVEAWVLVAHYAMLPAKVTGNLWLERWPTNMVTVAALVIGETNWKWIAWPASILKTDLDSLRLLVTASAETIPYVHTPGMS